MTIVEITAAAQAANMSLKGLCEAAKAFLTLGEKIDSQLAILDLQAKLTDHIQKHGELLMEHQAVVMERNALEEELAKLKKREADIRRYKLITVSGGLSVYALKKSSADGEPPHWLCPKCLAKDVKMLVAWEPCEFEAGRKQTMLHCIDCGYGGTVDRADFERAWGYV